MSKQTPEFQNIFGLPAKREESKIILFPVPWEVTTSYGSGTSRGPEAILEASPQIDLYDSEFGDTYKAGYFWEDDEPFFQDTNDRLKPLAQKVIGTWDEFAGPSDEHILDRQNVNSGCEEMVTRVYQKTQKILAQNKIPGVVGGDHSTPLGAIKALSEKFKGELGILHFDAHADLRFKYQGFQHSHASIMRNVCDLKVGPKKLVQVGIRDFCQEEYDFIRKSEGRISTFFDAQLKAALFKGDSWASLCEKIVSELPQNVYVSFDIDGLSPEFCPNTGTPVPGGLSFDQATFLLAILGRSQKKIIGFDLNEVSPGSGESEWDGNVGSRILFKLCGWAITTNK